MLSLLCCFVPAALSIRAPSQALDSFLYCIQKYGDLEEYWLVGSIDLMRDLRMKHQTEFNEHQLRRQQNSSYGKDDNVIVHVFAMHDFFFDFSKNDGNDLTNIYQFAFINDFTQ